MSTERPVFAGLDTLRAVASVAVVATHTCFWSGFYSHGTLGVATHRLEIGVPIFFVLSGFLLSYPYLASLRTSTQHDRAQRYALKRVARIAPVYVVTVVLALALLDQGPGWSESRWVANLLMYDYYLAENLPHGLGQMWSLYVEVAFYAALPILMWVAGRAVGGRWRPGVLLALVASMVALGAVWVLADGSQKALPGYLPWFGVGIAMAIVHLALRDAPGPRLSRLPVRVLRSLAAAPGVCWLSAAAVFLLASTPLTGPASLEARSTGEMFMRVVLYALVAGLVVLPSVFGPTDSRYALAMARPWARHLGHISYSLFCIHIVVLELLAPALGFTLFASNPVALFVVVLTISLVAAELLYRFVEKPVIDLVHRGRRHQRDSSTPTRTSTAA